MSKYEKSFLVVMTTLVAPFIAIIMFLYWNAITITVGMNNAVENGSFIEKEFEVINVNPPKQYYVDLKDVETGDIYEGLYVSKYCSDYKEYAVVGNHYRLKLVSFTAQGKSLKQIYHKDIDNTFCPKTI